MRIAVRMIITTLFLSLPSFASAQLVESEKVPGPWEAYHRLVEREIVATLGDSFPELAAKLEQEWYAEEEQPELRAEVARLLEAAQTLTGDRRGAAMLAADQLAGRIWQTEGEPNEWKATQQTLGGYGLTFQWNQLGGTWTYQHDLLWWLWRTSPTSRWGQHAFALLLERGWDTSGACQEGTNQFRRVIEQGENFLAGHPNGWPALQTSLALAQAYETWWSLSQAPENDDYANAADYQDGAKSARPKAIEYYEQVVRLAPSSEAAAYARLRLPRLKASEDTGERKFFCIYD